MADPMPAPVPQGDFVYPDGTEIPSADVPKALQEGAANVRAGSEIRMLDDGGKPMFVPAEKFNDALRAGWKYESPEEYKQRKYEEEFGAVEGAKAIAENLAKGVTVGLSDPILGAIGGQEYREKRAMRDEAAGMLATGAEVVGAVAPVLLSGGTSAPAQAGVRGAAQAAAKAAPSAILARGGAAVERGVAKAAEALLGTGTAAKVATKGAGLGAAGSFEGGVYGFGSGLSEAALDPDGNYNRLAEYVWENSKDGALLGLLGGGVLGAGVEAGGSAARKALGSSKGLISDDLMNKSAVRSLGDLPSLRNLTPEKIQQIGQDLQEIRLKDGKGIFETGEFVPSQRAIAKRVEEARELVSANYGAMKSAAADSNVPLLKTAKEYLAEADDLISKDYLSSPIKEIRARGEKVQESLTWLRENVAAQDAAQANWLRVTGEMRGRIAGELRTGYKSKSILAKADEIDGLLNQFEDAVASGGWQRTDMRNKLNAVLHDVEAGGYKASLKESAKDIRSQINKIYKETPKPLTLDDLLTQQQGMKRVIWGDNVPGANPALRQVPEHAAGLFSAERKLEAAIERHMDEVTGKPGEYAKARRLTESMIKADTMADKFARGVQARNDFSPSDKAAGFITTALQLARGDLTAPIQGVFAASVNRMLRERSSAGVLALGRALRKSEAVTASKVRRFIRSEDIRHAVTGPSLELLQGGNYREQVKSYNDLLQKVARASQQPPQLRVVDTAAPRTGIASKQLEKTILANILARAPSKPPAVDNPLAARALGYRRPTPSELARFERYVLTANNPDEAINALERGRLTKDHVDALRENYPNRYEHLKRTILQEITESPEPPEYAKLIKLGMLLNMPLVPTLDPVHIRISQSVYTPAEQGMAPPQQATGTPQNVDINPKKYATHIERIEAGEMDSI